MPFKPQALVKFRRPTSSHLKGVNMPYFKKSFQWFMQKLISQREIGKAFKGCTFSF